MCPYSITSLVCTKILSYCKSKSTCDSFLSLGNWTLSFLASCWFYRWSLVMFWPSQPRHTVTNVFGCTVALGLSQHESGVTAASRHCSQSPFPASLVVFLHCWPAYTSGKVNPQNSHTFQCTASPVTNFMLYEKECTTVTAISDANITSQTIEFI